MRRDVSDEQAALIAKAMDAQRSAIVAALEALARKLGFREKPSEEIAGSGPLPDVLRARRIAGRVHLFVGHARGFTEPVHDLQHQDGVHGWLRRFARLVDAQGTAAPQIGGGYVVVGTYDEASACAWASLLTKLARPHRVVRDGAPARFVVRRLGRFWMAC